MILKNLLRTVSNNTYSYPMMSQLRNCQINQGQFKFFTIQRMSIAYNFENLLVASLRQAKAIGDSELALALQRNLADENGEDEEGKVDPKKAHKYWRKSYFSALNITDVDQDLLLPETINHSNIMRDIEKENDFLVMSGALLASEIIIPIEYRNARFSRDHLFPEAFVVNVDDDAETIESKHQACLYIDDHIIHDAKSHFPELLNALNKYENNADQLIKIKQGIDLIKDAREIFYKGINAAWASM